MLVVFEGIDGSGKTTLSGRVAAALRERGIGVEHVREGGRFASPITQGLREFTRDARNLKLVPEAELLLYAAREAQLLRESTLPAMARAEIVLADRFFFTAGILAVEGRGLPSDVVAPILRAATGGVEPDLVFWVDADPHVARARRRVSKVLAAKSGGSSRKGLSGTGLQHRLRDGYRRLAQGDPTRWIVLENDDEPLESMVEWVVALLQIARGLGPQAAIRAAQQRCTTSTHARVDRGPGNAEEARTRLLRWVDDRAVLEPALAAWILGGLYGPGVDERRIALSSRAPEVVAAGLHGLQDRVSWRLRAVLAGVAPRQVARSLAGASDASASMRARLAAMAPREVALSLRGLDDAISWAMREALEPVVPSDVLRSLSRIGSERAWKTRERLLATASAAARAASVTGLDDPRAWEIRRSAREAAPVEALASIGGLGSEEAWAWREELAAFAPRVVLRTIDGDDSPRSWVLRRRAAPRCKEALDSMTGLDSNEAWAFREEYASRWPSTVAKSLGPLASESRGRAMLESLLARSGHDLSLWRHAAAAMAPEESMAVAAVETA